MNADAERRILAEIEHDLQASDPKLVRRLERPPALAAHATYRRMAGWVFLSIAAWLAVVSLTPVPVGAPWVKPLLLACSLILLTGVCWIAQTQRRPRLRHPQQIHRAFRRNRLRQPRG